MENTQECIAVLLAGGTGTRMGHKLPKQYIEVDGVPVISYTLMPFLNCGRFKTFVICAEKDWHSYILQHFPTGYKNITVEFSEPGATRQFTVYNALKLIAERHPECRAVIIHDAARPLVTEGLIERCMNALGEADGILPALPVKDTIYMSADGRRIDSLLNRSTLFAGQSPEVFRFRPYHKAHLESAEEEIARINGSSELALLKGLTVDIIPGEEKNFKITTPEDLERFRQILKDDSKQTIRHK